MQVGELSADDVSADLRRFRTSQVRWSQPQRFRSFTSIGRVCSIQDAGLTDEQIRDRLAQMLDAFVEWLEADGACLSGDSRRPLHFAAEHLLRRNSETAELPMVGKPNRKISVDQVIAAGWGVDLRSYDESKPMEHRTFQQEHVNQTYEQLADKFIEFAALYEMPDNGASESGETSDHGEKAESVDGHARDWRGAKMLAVAVTVVAIGLLTVVFRPWPFQKDKSGQFAPSQPTLAEGVGIASGIQAIDRSHAPKWGSELNAEPIDRIEFDVWLVSRSRTETGPITAWLDIEQLGDSNGNRVRAVVLDAKNRLMIRSPWLVSRSMTSPYGPLATTGKQIGNVSGTDDGVQYYDDDNRPQGSGEIQSATSFPSSTGVSNVRQPLGVPEPAWSIKFPKLGPNQSVHAMFEMAWSPFGTMPTFKNLIGFTDVNLNGQYRDSARSIDVDVGDKIVVTETVAPSSTDVVPLPVYVRAVLKRENGSRPSQLSFVLSGPTTGKLKFIKLGETRIKAVSAFGPSGQPVKLELVPRSTYVYSVDRDSCGKGGEPQWHPEVASDDLTRTEGLALGGVGGYLPRDRCSGEGFRKKFSATFRVVRAN